MIQVIQVILRYYGTWSCFRFTHQRGMSSNRKEFHIRFVFGRNHPFSIVQPIIYLNMFIPLFQNKKPTDFHDYNTVVDASNNECYRITLSALLELGGTKTLVGLLRPMKTLCCLCCDITHTQRTLILKLHQWIPRVVMLQTVSSLDAPKFIVMATYSATTNDNVDNMTTIVFFNHDFS